MSARFTPGSRVYYIYRGPDNEIHSGYGIVEHGDLIIGTDFGYALLDENGNGIHVRDSGVREAVYGEDAISPAKFFSPAELDKAWLKQSIPFR